MTQYLLSVYQPEGEPPSESPPAIGNDPPKPEG